MKYFEITNKEAAFKSLSLSKVLESIRQYAVNAVWSLQTIQAVGNIEKTCGMTMMELEAKCRESEKGVLISFEKLVEIALICDDIVEILLVANMNGKGMPKAYRDPDWESKCQVIISLEDSSFWQFYSTDKKIMGVFETFKCGNQ